MEPVAVDSSFPSSALSGSAGDRRSRFTVDGRFVIAIIILFGSAIAATIRFGHEVFDPLAESFMIQGWAAVIARPSLLWFAMGMLLLIVRTILWLRYHPFPAAQYESAPACPSSFQPTTKERWSEKRSVLAHRRSIPVIA
ncbi:MAG: hypothetical protein KGO52_15985 [Nitrospirota bacterium]|nr:hypothetical protein [Nitrospirota bacterium]